MLKLRDIKLRRKIFDRDFFYLDFEFEKPNGLIVIKSVYFIKGQEMENVSLVAQGLVNILKKED